MIQPIVVGIDPDRPNDAPLAFAAQLARAYGAPLWAVAVVVADGLGSVPASEAARGSAESAINAIEATAYTAGAQPRVIRASTAARGLHELANADGALVIVVGSTHRGRLGRIVPGAVTDRLMHGSPCPVAVVPGGYRPEGPLRRVGVAFDGWPESAAALGVARDLADRASARVRVLTVMEPGAPPATPGLPPPDSVEHRRQRAADVLERGMHLLPEALRDDGRVLEGSAAEALARAADDLDLLVCGSRSYGPMRSVLLGSVSGALIRTSARPLLVVPRGVEAADGAPPGP